MSDYAERLSRDGTWALSEGSRFFEEKSAVQDSLRAITKRLEELGIAYAVAGGMALFKHGVRRFTEDVDILVSAESLQRIHEKLEGLGYVAPFKGSKNLKDAQTGIRIEFLVQGQFPGDGKPKPVAFPDPASSAIEIDGIKYLGLPQLVELKLASGLTGGIHRMKDFADVIALIEALNLDAQFGERLNPYVRDKYLELFQGIKDSPKLPE